MRGSPLSRFVGPDGEPSGADRIDPAAVLTGVPEGERNDTLFRFVSRHRGLGLSREEATTLALAAGHACDPRLPDSETRRIVQNVYDRYESGRYGSKSTFSRTLNTLKDKGYVEDGGGMRGNLYAVTATGREALGLNSVEEVSDGK
jgi:hypothetical protein